MRSGGPMLPPTSSTLPNRGGAGNAKAPDLFVEASGLT